MCNNCFEFVTKVTILKVNNFIHFFSYIKYKRVTNLATNNCNPRQRGMIDTFLPRDGLTSLNAQPRDVGLSFFHDVVKKIQ